ncbi:MAG: hypothetical protein ACXWMH_13230 [Syntrophales bacterium]
MKRIIALMMTFITMLIFLSGCFVAVEDHDRGGRHERGEEHERGEGHERGGSHEER